MKGMNKIMIIIEIFIEDSKNMHMIKIKAKLFLDNYLDDLWNYIFI